MGVFVQLLTLLKTNIDMSLIFGTILYLCHNGEPQYGHHLLSIFVKYAFANMMVFVLHFWPKSMRWDLTPFIHGYLCIRYLVPYSYLFVKACSRLLCSDNMTYTQH